MPQELLQTLVRDNIRQLKPYASARDEFKGEAAIFLDANENSWGSPYPTPYHRYPDPLQWDLKQQIADIKGVLPQQIFLGNGSDEAIDLLFRVFCEPGRDHALILPPTYGMYAVQANIHGAALKKVPLDAHFQPDVDAILAQSDAHSKLLFLCSPNNPTGNLLHADRIAQLLAQFKGIVVVDEAYIDFANAPSWATKVDQYPNLVVLQTLSKAWGLAGLRIGMAIANEALIGYLNKVKYPYNIGTATMEVAKAALQQQAHFQQVTDCIKTDRETLEKEIKKLKFVHRVYPSDANFLLVQVENADHLYAYLTAKGVVVRNRSKEPGCGNCLRITVGTTPENEALLNILSEYHA